MSTFIYEAYDRHGGVIRGEYEGVKKDEVVDYLVKRDLTPVSVEELTARGRGGTLLSISLFEHIAPVDVMFLVRNLATTIKAGLSIVESLDILIADTEKRVMKKVLQETQAMVKNGQPLSKGFESYAHAFPPIFMGMLKAGEISGGLDRVLAELSRYLSKEYALRSKVRSALMYPLILLIASVGVLVLLLIFVLPRLSKAFLTSGVKLPWVTKFFLSISNALTWSFIFDAVVIGGLIWFFLYFRKTPRGKKTFFWIISRLPVARDVVKKVALVRFSRTLGNLIGSGLSAVESLELSADSLGNEVYTIAIHKAVDEIKSGKSISEALGKYPELFPRLLLSMVVVGERTGSLQEILISYADFSEEEVDNKLKDLTAVLEPVLLLIMGLVVGAIAFSIILPIYQLVGHFV